MKVAFVTNICSHYRVGTFEALARRVEASFCFFSAGDEWYWQRQHGVSRGDFACAYLPGFSVGHTRICLSLPIQLARADCDVFVKCINGRFALPVTYLIARLRRKPFVLWTGIWTRLGTLSQRLLFPLTRYLYRHADAIVTYGEHVSDYLVGEGVNPDRVFATKHAVDNEAYSRPVARAEREDLQKRLGLSERQKVVLYLGRLEDIKGLPFLLEAIAAIEHKDVVLVIAGTGSQMEMLQARAAEADLAGRVRFAGYVPIEQAVVYYSIATVLVLPSITANAGKETWGLVVNEAFNQGVPVVVTESVGAAAGGLAEDGVTGLVVSERDSNALTMAIQRILSDDGLRETLGQNARQRVKEWNNEAMADGFVRAIEYAVSERRSRTVQTM